MARAALPALALAFLLASPAARAGTEEVLRCLDLADPAARLACYDRAVPALRTAPASPAAAPIQPTGPTLSPEQQFGLPAAELRKQQPGGSVEAITAKVVSLREQAPGRYVASLDNGQVWMIKETGRIRLSAGETVEVRRGTVSGFVIVPEKVPTLLRAERLK
ncbi:hypothetical protein HHL28_13955 [Aerophototrophica crusticola]|uniref:Type IV pilus biogenesis protein PilP n=1 Tax=Aerophototrophica crusticola TaxID=1709002 RepID=A0A858R998_9PROT|nr:hypothetical protein HHL28_13955 [Rhodospirillaceae bacterium B3]